MDLRLHARALRVVYPGSSAIDPRTKARMQHWPREPNLIIRILRSEWRFPTNNVENRQCSRHSGTIFMSAIRETCRDLVLWRERPQSRVWFLSYGFRLCLGRHAQKRQIVSDSNDKCVFDKPRRRVHCCRKLWQAILSKRGEERERERNFLLHFSKKRCRSTCACPTDRTTPGAFTQCESSLRPGQDQISLREKITGTYVRRAFNDQSISRSRATDLSRCLPCLVRSG